MLTGYVEDSEKAELCTEVILDSKYYDNDPNKLRAYLNIERNRTKYTALQMAAIAGHHTLIPMLIRSGADPKKVDHVGRNVFHRAAGNGKMSLNYSKT